jgi:hypothetical protein
MVIHVWGVSEIEIMKYAHESCEFRPEKGCVGGLEKKITENYKTDFSSERALPPHC